MLDIDKLAKAAFDAFWRGFKTTTWEQQEEKYKENWRNVVRDTIEEYNKQLSQRSPLDCNWH